MAAQGQDPSNLIKNIADVIERRRNGDSIEAAALAVFTPPVVEAPAQMQPETAPMGQQAPVEQAPQSPVAPGQPPVGAPQQPGQPQPPQGGGTPDLATILAGLQG